MWTSYDPNAPGSDRVFTVVRGAPVSPVLRETMKIHYYLHGELNVRLVSREKYAIEQMEAFVRGFSNTAAEMAAKFDELINAVARMQVKVITEKHFPRIGVNVPKATSEPPAHSSDNEPWRRSGKRRGSRPR